MITRFAAAFSFLTFAVFFSSAQTAFAATPEANYESAPTRSLTTAQPSIVDQKWAMLVYIHGMGNQAGVALGGETPSIFSGMLSVRASYSLDMLKNSATDGSGDLSFAFGTAQAGLKFHMNHESNIGLFNAVLVNINYYLPYNSTTRGSLWGDEVCYQLEWRNRYLDGWSGSENDFAAFIEMGLSDSNLRATTDHGGGQIGNGFISRLGFRRFF